MHTSSNNYAAQILLTRISYSHARQARAAQDLVRQQIALRLRDRARAAAAALAQGADQFEAFRIYQA